MRQGTIAIAVLLAGYAAFSFPAPAAAQFNLTELNLAPRNQDAPKLEVTASLSAEGPTTGANGTLTLTAKIPTGFYLYAITDNSPARTQIQLSETPGVEPLGEFTAVTPAKRSFDANLQQEVEKHTGQAVWTRPVRVTGTVAQVSGTLVGTYCGTGEGGLCIRTEEPFIASLNPIEVPSTPAGALAGDAQPADFTETVAPAMMGKPNSPGPASVKFTLSPANAQPGETVTLSIAMTLGDGWHTYSLSQPVGPGAMPTAITLEKSRGLTPLVSSFNVDREPQRKTLDTDSGPHPIEQYEKNVTWTREFRVEEATYGVAGKLRYIICNDANCLPPTPVNFSLGDLQNAADVPAAVAGTDATPDTLSEEFSLGEETGNLGWQLLQAFLGGLILNVMPCVLPVVAIKVMSFVQQAGEDRGRIFVLNAVYSTGVVSVFLLLAAMAALPQLFGGVFEVLGLTAGEFNWGKLFQSETFNWVMACLVFVMGLSLLGVFEIPIPGMIGSAAGAAHREGLTGAFFTGVFATLLATPCTGPFMGSVLVWSVKQPAAVIFLVWATMGLGMASPYLLFGLVPGAVKLMPKPGAWMMYFKQFAGFVLMGTVLFLMTSVKTDELVPLLIVLLGLAIALWMIGLVQPDPSRGKKLAVSAVALVLGGVVANFGYGLTVESPNTLPWDPFTTARLNELREAGKPVLIDFTASWCANCKVNERLALNTPETKAFVEQHRITTLEADFSDEGPEIRLWLDKFGAIGVPLTVIFPAGRPNEPIVLDGVYTQATLLEKLDEAVRPKN